MFGGEHLVFGALGAFPLLFLEFIDPLLLCALSPQDLHLYFVQQDAAGEETVKTAGPFLHAFDLNAEGAIAEINTASCRIHMAPAGTGGTYESLRDIFFAHLQAEHPLFDGCFFR